MKSYTSRCLRVIAMPVLLANIKRMSRGITRRFDLLADLRMLTSPATPEVDTMPVSASALPVLPADDPYEIVRKHFKKTYPRIVKKVELQVRRTPRRLTGPHKTNRDCRWLLDPQHPDYTAPDQVKLIEAKLLSQMLSFEHAPDVPAEVSAAAAKVLRSPTHARNVQVPSFG